MGKSSRMANSPLSILNFQLNKNEYRKKVTMECYYQSRYRRGFGCCRSIRHFSL